MLELKHQEDTYKKVINDQLMHQYLMKQKRLEKLSDSEDSARGDKKNMRVGGSSTATKTSPTKAATEPPLHMGVNLNNQNMVEKLKDLKEIRAEFDVKQKKHEKSLKKENQRRKRQS